MEATKKQFCHLHLHSGYSLLDGSGKVSQIVKRAKDLGMESIAITDHGVMYGCVDFYKEAKANGIKPILGCEVYVVPKSMHIKNIDSDNKTYHLVLLVKNEVGYENLMKIASVASIEGFYYKPRVDREFLKQHSEGLIALSACLGGEVQKAVLNSKIDEARETALAYKEIFKDGFYLEIQDHGMEEQKKVNEINIQLSKELDIPLVATNDVHYIYQDDSKAHDILMCIQTGKTVDDPNRRRYPSDQFYLKSPEEMWNLFDYIPEALENTVKIAEQCNFDYEFHVSKLPKFHLPEGVDAFDYLRQVCFSGLIDRMDELKELRDDYSIERVYELYEISPKVKEDVDRLEYELGVIKQMGYVDYFLITWDFIKYANDNGIPTGPGRGCFLPETKVLMGNGSVKNINDVKCKDEVITAHGNLSLVQSLLSYDVEEEIVVIEACNEVVKLTADHEVLAIKSKPCIKQWEDRTKLPVVCKESCSVYRKGKCVEAPCNNYEPEWIEAKELNNNDFVIYPRTKENKIDVVYDLLDYCNDDSNIRYDKNHVWYEIGSNNLATNKITRFINVNFDLCKLIGYFIAEGWTHINNELRTYKFGFGFNKKETDYVDEVTSLCEKIFGVRGTVFPHKEKQSIAVEFNSKVIAQFLLSICGKGANNKKIPYDLVKYCSNEELRYLVAYMFRGDGSHSDIQCKSSSLRIKYTTTSFELTRQLRMVLARLGYWSTFKTRVKPEEAMHDEYSVCVSGEQLLKWNNDFTEYEIPIREQKFYRDDGFYLDENYIYLKVKNKSTEQYKGKVYDLSVPGDTSYVANSMAVHNSAAGSLVAYTLGITKIDPMKYSLLFERFLNPERVSMPD